MAQPIWGIRGGDDGRLVDRFVDGGYVGVLFPEVGDGRTLDRYQITRALERAGVKDPQAEAQRFSTFVGAIHVGDPVLMPDAGRKDIVIGIVDGDYEYDESVVPSACRHRRKVNWLRRHSRDELPPQWLELYRQKLVIARYEATSLTDHVASVIAGEIGRPATQRGAAARVRSSSAGGSRSSSPRAPRKPKAPERVLKTCPSCGFNLNIVLFEGQDTCRDCR